MPEDISDKGVAGKHSSQRINEFARSVIIIAANLDGIPFPSVLWAPPSRWLRATSSAFANRRGRNPRFARSRRNMARGGGHDLEGGPLDPPQLLVEDRQAL